MNTIRLRGKDGTALGKPVGTRGFITYELSELLDSVPVPTDWGPWRLDVEHLALYMDGNDYWVDLADCLTSARVLDKVIQISGKAWADDALIAGLIRALDDVLDPQANLCPFGASKRLGKRRVGERASDAEATRAEGFRVYPELQDTTAAATS
jgi:hypothetical protein